MIVVDTSAIIAILKEEPQGAECRRALEASGNTRISAATVTETMIVGLKHNFQPSITALIAAMEMTVESLTPERAQRAAAAYALWGKGFHPAGLNFGDCFAYALAKEFNCPLLYIGDDFRRTDIGSAVST